MKCNNFFCHSHYKDGVNNCVVDQSEHGTFALFCPQRKAFDRFNDFKLLAEPRDYKPFTDYLKQTKKELKS